MKDVRKALVGLLVVGAVCAVIAGYSRVIGAAHKSDIAVGSSEAKVELYVTTWCPYCRKMQSFLEQQGVAFIQYDIEKDDAAAERFTRMGGVGIPLTRVGDVVVHGYDVDKVAKALIRLETQD